MTAATPALTHTPVLRTERLVLRAPEGSDWEAWCAFAMSDRARHMGGPYSRDTAWRAFGHAIGHWAMRGFGSFVFTTPEGTPLGMTGPWYPEGWPERELGWSVWAPGAEGKGLAFEAAAAARDHAFSDLGWTSAVSYIAPANDRSAALALRLGAVEEPGAAFPGDGPCRVFRHPRPEAA